MLVRYLVPERSEPGDGQLDGGGGPEGGGAGGPEGGGARHPEGGGGPVCQQGNGRHAGLLRHCLHSGRRVTQSVSRDL